MVLQKFYNFTCTYSALVDVAMTDTVFDLLGLGLELDRILARYTPSKYNFVQLFISAQLFLQHFQVSASKIKHQRSYFAEELISSKVRPGVLTRIQFNQHEQNSKLMNINT